jgi:hypothetical protein
MGEGSPKPASTPTGAVFLSYASQDAEAAQKICEALRAAGIEVWFDKSELRGGDAWDQMIRRQIRACRLFVPVISAQTDARREGYFRREWKLALDRTHDMSVWWPGAESQNACNGMIYRGNCSSENRDNPQNNPYLTGRKIRRQS